MAGSAPTRDSRKATTLSGQYSEYREWKQHVSFLISNISAVANRKLRPLMAWMCRATWHPLPSNTIHHKEPATQAARTFGKRFMGASAKPMVKPSIMASEILATTCKAIPGHSALIGSKRCKDMTFPCLAPHYGFQWSTGLRMFAVGFAKLAGPSVIKITYQIELTKRLLRRHMSIFETTRIQHSSLRSHVPNGFLYGETNARQGWTKDGKEYVDSLLALGVLNFGSTNNPRWSKPWLITCKKTRVTTVSILKTQAQKRTLCRISTYFFKKLETCPHCMQSLWDQTGTNASGKPRWSWPERPPDDTISWRFSARLSRMTLWHAATAERIYFRQASGVNL